VRIRNESHRRYRGDRGDSTYPCAPGQDRPFAARIPSHFGQLTSNHDLVASFRATTAQRASDISALAAFFAHKNGRVSRMRHRIRRSGKRPGADAPPVREKTRHEPSLLSAFGISATIIPTSRINCLLASGPSKAGQARQRPSSPVARKATFLIAPSGTCLGASVLQADFIRCRRHDVDGRCESRRTNSV
jgi:hypothetical protein